MRDASAEEESNKEGRGKEKEDGWSLRAFKRGISPTARKIKGGDRKRGEEEGRRRRLLCQTSTSFLRRVVL